MAHLTPSIRAAWSPRRLLELARRGYPQPTLGLVLGALALICLLMAWHNALAPRSITPLDLTNVGLGFTLVAGAILAQIYQVHVSRGYKLTLLTLVVYLLATLTAPPIAALSAGAAVLIGEFTQRHVKGQYPSDIASTVGRWIIIVFVGSLLAHLPSPYLPPLRLAGVTLPLGAPLTRLPLALAAIWMFIGDTLSVSLEIGAITGEAPHRVLRMVLHDGTAAEALQYLAGLLGSLAARQDAWTIVLLLVPAVLLRRLLKRGMEMHDETRTLLESMADAVDLRDAYTGGHSRRVTAYSRDILRALDIRGPEVDLITAAARVHDIGKIAIPDGILNKPDQLTGEERAIMESHPRRGAEFLARYHDFQRGINIVLSHHERIDGQGYPDGLRGDDIPFGARIVAVADSFDAMTSDRPYRQGMSISKAGAILNAGRGTQWDAQIVDVFVRQVIPTLLAQTEIASSGHETLAGDSVA